MRRDFEETTKIPKLTNIIVHKLYFFIDGEVGYFMRQRESRLIVGGSPLGEYILRRGI